MIPAFTFSSEATLGEPPELFGRSGVREEVPCKDHNIFFTVSRIRKILYLVQRLGPAHLLPSLQPPASSPGHRPGKLRWGRAAHRQRGPRPWLLLGS